MASPSSLGGGGGPSFCQLWKGQDTWLLCSYSLLAVLLHLDKLFLNLTPVRVTNGFISRINVCIWLAVFPILITSNLLHYSVMWGFFSLHVYSSVE